MKQKPCSVCGGTDTKLIDGYYYCVECGTQDVDAQQTIVEQTVLADGNAAFVNKKKLTTILKDAVEMSEEWHKWHILNFVVCGLVEEVMALGASPGFQTKALWIWTRYMNKFMKKDEMGLANKNNDDEDFNISKLFDLEEVQDENLTEDEKIDKVKKGKKGNRAKEKEIKIHKCITEPGKPLMLSIIYLALNYDQSDIQLSHLLRFMREKRISINNLNKFVPKELNARQTKFKRFLSGRREVCSLSIRELSLNLIIALKLGPPLVPDLRKIINNYVKELCLPSEFKNLVYSLMHKYPCDFLKHTDEHEYKARLPDYEVTMMSYILLALKMCFGLDDQYEIKLSEAVDKINSVENRLKSYKKGMQLESTDRLFCFREWCNYLQLRKVMLCKYYLPMAADCNLDVDDHILMEQMGEEPKKKANLSTECTIDILNKIHHKEERSVIPISEFPPSLTSLSDYTNIIAQYIEDPELNLPLSEDFTQYSLKYACMDLKIGDDTLNGIKEENKSLNKNITCKLDAKKTDMSLVYVRNCENKNWLKTKPPTKDHLIKIDKDDVASDHENDSCLQINANDVESTTEAYGETEIEKVLETIEEEPFDCSIFDDDFADTFKDEKDSNGLENESIGFQNEIHNNIEFQNETDLNDDDNDLNFSESRFDPKKFDRERTIKELILFACKEYKIPIPDEYKDKESRKRKNSANNTSGERNPKVKKVNNRTKPGGAQNELNEILNTYYMNLKDKLLNKVSQDIEHIFNDITIENINQSNQNDYNVSMEVSNADDNLSALKVGEEVDQKDKTIEIIETTSETETNIDDLASKVDPRFDEKTYDIKQLYLKFSEEFDFDELLDIDDKEIYEIVDKKHEKLDTNKQHVTKNDDCDKESLYDSEDDVPLKSVAEKLKLQKSFVDQNAIILESLIQNSENITEFNYWFRHYNSTTMVTRRTLKEMFDEELIEKCPKSFNFLIFECASVLYVDAFMLYKCLQDFEKFIDNQHKVRALFY